MEDEDDVKFVICPECGWEQADMGCRVSCEECGYWPMPTGDGEEG